MTPFDAAPADRREPADRPMAAVYVAVIVVEIVTLLALWWFQSTFGRA